MKRDGEERIEVTDENFGDLLLQGLREVHDIVCGDVEPARRVRRMRTARETVVAPPRQYRGDRIQKIREQMGLSQSVFAQVLNASPDTIKAWEQDKRQPDGMALALLEVAEHHPKVLLDRVKTRTPKRNRE
jgi:putative transcriptional regulator